MLKIGLTGGIGSGKSTVARIFEVLGIPVYYADDSAKRLMNENRELKERIKEHFGSSVYSDGQLDRKQLAAMVFSNPEKLDQLNALVHPATLADAQAWLQQQKAPYAIKEAALIFESGAQQFLDKVIGISAPAPLRIQRAMKRDHAPREAIIARIGKQLDEDIKMRLCDYVITNDEQQLVIPQVLAVHEELLRGIV